MKKDKNDFKAAATRSVKTVPMSKPVKTTT